MEKQTIGWMFMLSGKNGIVRVKVNFDDRFKDDKFYCDNEKITIVSDGVILNKSELFAKYKVTTCLLYTSPSPRDAHESRMPSSA